MVNLPYMVSFSLLALILVMAYELSRDVLRASRLVGELQESEERLSLAADAAKLGIWIRDFSSDEIWATDRWRALFGFAPTEPLAFDKFLGRMHPEDRKVFDYNFTKALAGGGSYEMEYRLVLPDGKTRWIASRGHVEFNGGGRPKLLRGISVDITDRKLSEMEVMLRRNELTHLSRVTMLGELSGSMAHELNQPLASILYNAEAALALLEQNPPDLNEVRETLNDILVEDRRAGEVIRRLRLLLTKGEVQRQALDLNEIVREVLKLVRVDLVSRGVAVHTELAPTLPTVLADRIQLQQVLLNLVINGCDAMAGDATDSKQIVVRTGRSEGEGLWVSVGDKGQGLAPGTLEKVFDPFFTTKSRGMGLGLSVCRTIISAHGGKLWAANNEDRGATFRFSLPASGSRSDAALASSR